MIIISSRQNFNDPDVISGVHKIKDVNLQNGAELGELEYNSFKKNIKGKKVLLLVHGYNNEPYEVYDAYQIIEENIRITAPDIYDYVIGYSWPGGDFVLEWRSAKSRANSVARIFRSLLEDINNEASSIDVMSHSLGARVVLKALKETKKVLINNYYCTAPAVDNECLEPEKEFSQSISFSNRIFVFHSARDGVLRISYEVAEMDRALGLNGPEDKDYISKKSKNIYVINCKKVISHHGGYKRSTPIYSYIKDYQEKNPEKFKTL